MSLDTKKVMEVPEKILSLCDGGNSDVNVFRAEWDEEGVYFYQAYNQQIADYALREQNFGGEGWNPDRMSWIKPSLAWMLYRSRYGYKDKNQARILKVKLSHEVVTEILTNASLASSASASENICRVQWDPERDLWASQMDKKGEHKEPRKTPHIRAIQIGISQQFSIQNIKKLKIEDVTDLARAVGGAHNAETEEDCVTMMTALTDKLPRERPYLPRLPQDKLIELKLFPKPTVT